MARPEAKFPRAPGLWITPRPISARIVEMAVTPVHPEQLSTLWEQVLLSVKSRLASHQAFETWFRPIVARELSPQWVDLEVPNAFFVDWIHEHHLSALRSAFVDVLGACPEIRFSPCEPASPPVATAVAAPPRAVPDTAAPSPRNVRLWLESQLHPRLTFESFVVGASNRFTHAAA